MQLPFQTFLQGKKDRIEKVLGQGGFGITYLATMKVEIKGPLGIIQTEINVAVKEFFMKELCNRDEYTKHVSVPSTGSIEQVESYRKKFRKEAENLSKLNHPNIVKVLDVFDENGTSYYVMEYIDGGSLQQYVSQSGALTEKTALNYISQLAAALGYMHTHRLCHLDIKPSNILITADRTKVLLIDFGLSKQYDPDGNQTSSTPVGISEGYAPMEQYEPGGVSEFSPATDIYSLGATLFFLLSGVKPPKASLVLNEGLPELSGSISDTTQRAIEKAMNPRRKERPQTITNFSTLLNSQKEKEPMSSSINSDDTTKIITDEEKLQTSDEKTPKFNLSQSTWTLIVSVAILTGIVILFSVSYRGNEAKKRELALMDSIRIGDSIAALENTPVLNDVAAVVDTTVLSVAQSTALDEKQALKENLRLAHYGFSEGIALINKNKKWGYIDKNGTIVIPLKYDYAASFSEGLAAVEKNGKRGYIDKDGNTMISFKYNYAEPFSEGLALIGINGKEGFFDRKYGFINKSGKMVTQCIYDFANSFSEGLAAVSINGKWGFIDKSGTIVVQCQYNNVSSFKGGETKAELNGETFRIDKRGNRI
jgi:Serine/threonine protein kinase